MSKNFYNLPDAEFGVKSTAFYGVVNAAPTTYGTTSTVMTQYNTLNLNYQTSLALALGETTRTKLTIGNKNLAKKALRDYAMALCSVIRNTSTVTNPMLESLGLLPRTQRQPIPAPASQPLVEIVSQTGRIVKIRLRDTEGGGRGKPNLVRSATLFSHVGPSAPDDINEWTYEGVATKVVSEISFPNTVPGGSLVWITAIWANNRAESGPAADPVSTNIAGGGISQAA